MMTLESAGLLLTALREVEAYRSRHPKSWRELRDALGRDPFQWPPSVTARYPAMSEAVRTWDEHSRGQTELRTAWQRLLDRTPGTPVRAAVFVHGIYSDPESAFAAMHKSFAADPDFSGWLLAGHAYDFHKPIADNGRVLAQAVAGALGDCEVALICHSMGGLLGRVAVLSGAAPCVRKLFMIGTPNYGAFRSSQLGLLSQMALDVSGKIYGVFRQPGVRDLTQVQALLKDIIGKGMRNADNVDYVSIPGIFFHEDRRAYSFGGKSGAQVARAAFGALNMGLMLVMMSSLWAVRLRAPHDGIVEEQSNRLIPVNGKSCEKMSKRGLETYNHFKLPACQELTHVEIQHNPDVIGLVKSLLFAGSVREWVANVPAEFDGLLEHLGN